MSDPPRAYTTVVAPALSAEEARDLLRAIIEATPLAIYAKDRQRCFLLSNRQHAALIGRSPEQILGHTDAELFGAEGEAVDAASLAVLESGTPATQEFAITLGDSPRTFLETIFPITDDTGRTVGLGGIAADITARRRLEDALAERARELESALADLRALKDQLVRQEKMAALGALVAGVAHEVSSPLGVALTASSLFEGYVGELEALVNDKRLTRSALASTLARMREASALTVKNTERAARLLQAFKQVAADRSQCLTREATLGPWLDEVLLSLTPTLRAHRARVETVVEAEAPVIVAASELQQIVTNLVVNAAVHGFGDDPDAGAEPPPPDARIVTVSVRTEARGLELIVRDNGRGMGPEVAAHVYDPFFTTRRGRGGTGLGLHITHAIVTETFGGCIDLETSPGHGASFRVVMPWKPGALSPTKR